MEGTMPGREIAELFRKVISGTAAIEPDGESWDEVYAGNFGCTIDGYELTIFNDCDSVDYVDSATSPDGREGDFDSWFHAKEEPVSLLSDEEIDSLAAALKACGARKE